jgi:uncharacterized iron-regulated protein
MDLTSIIAVAGLATALLTALIVPLIQGRIDAKNATVKRLEEQQESTYVDAMAYVQTIEKRLDALLEDPLVSSGDLLPRVPDDFMIRARMFLVAPATVARAFDDLTLAWEVLSWNVNESGPDEMIGDIPIYRAKRDDEDVVRVANALKRLKSVIRPKVLGAVD